MVNDFSSNEGELVPQSKSIVQVKVGSREYSMVRSTRCAVCMHPGRFTIEEKMLLNFGYPAIVRFIAEQPEIRKDDGSVETWPELTRTQLINHRNAGHVAANAEILHEFAQRRAEILGFDFETSSGALTDHYIGVQMVLQDGIERLVRGEIKPEVKDLLAASKMLADLENNNKQDATIEQYQELIPLFFAVVQKRVPAETFKVIMGEIQTHPVVKKYQQQQKAIEG